MRLIDADALFPYGAVPYEKDGFATADKLYGIIKDAPTIDAVPAVRCKDCKHFTDGMAIGMCKRNPLNPILPMPYNNYCGFGERKDGDG